jgi:hypothetical protein
VRSPRRATQMMRERHESTAGPGKEITADAVSLVRLISDRELRRVRAAAQQLACATLNLPSLLNFT